MTKIVSFGDSFIFGSEINGNQAGELGWPGIAAHQIGCEFESRAVPGCGNQHIAKQIIDYFAVNSAQDTLAVINWTWSVRWDILDRIGAPDITLGPTCDPHKLQQSMELEPAEKLLDFYREFVNTNAHSYVATSLQAMLAAQYFLRTRQIATVQTYMDDWMFTKNLFGPLVHFYNEIKEPEWPVMIDQDTFDQLPATIQNEVLERYAQLDIPPWISAMQDMVLPDLQTWQGMNFLDWSYAQGFEVTPDPYLHPLLSAHQAAAQYWIPSYDKALA